jgi:hypothetical protein
MCRIHRARSRRAASRSEGTRASTRSHGAQNTFAIRNPPKVGPISTRIPTSIAHAAGTKTARARRLTRDVAKPSSMTSAVAASARLSHSCAAIQSPAPVSGSASDTWYAARVSTIDMVGDATQARPAWRSLATPAAKKTSDIATQIARIGHVYSPLGGGSGSGAVSAHASPAREQARTPSAITSSASKWYVCPKLCGRPSR